VAIGGGIAPLRKIGENRFDTRIRQKFTKLAESLQMSLVFFLYPFVSIKIVNIVFYKLVDCESFEFMEIANSTILLLFRL